MTEPIHALTPSRRPSPLVVVAELLLVAVLIFSATRILQDFSPTNRVRGSEFSYLISSGTVAANIYHRTGSIPLWNPLIGKGEPLFESPFSYILNPFMSAPVLLFGPLNGAKLSVVFHALVMGFGGWTLAYVLRLSWVGRVFLALVLAGSGSLTGAIGEGFYQMALSQTYVPWVYAGLIGTLYRRERRYVGLLVVASALMIFAGTFWYVLPTALVSIVLVAFGVVGREPTTRRLTINRHALNRVLVAGAFVVGVSAVRLLPQAAYSDLVGHEYEYLRNTGDFFEVVRKMFTPNLPEADIRDKPIHYHYILPLWFAGVLLVGRVALLARGFGFGSRWRVIVPAALGLLFFTIWAQEGVPLMLWLYERIELLREWRFVVRMLAAATPLLALLAAIFFDDITLWLARLARTRLRPALESRVRVARVGGALAWAIPAVMIGLGGASALHVLDNWNRVTGVMFLDEFERIPLTFLREQRPGDFLMVHTQGFFGYMAFWDTNTRASLGNPDYRPIGMTSTIGRPEDLNFQTEYAIGMEPGYRSFLLESGYLPVPAVPNPYDFDALFRNPTSPGHSFIVPRATMEGRTTPLTRAEVMPVNHFDHGFDVIRYTVGDYAPGSVLVAMETAYPGWTVTVNGSPAPLESVGGMIGVVLPPYAGTPVRVIFEYRPLFLTVSAVMTFVAMAAFSGYLLRLERLLPMRVRVRLGEWGQTRLRQYAREFVTPIPADADVTPGVPMLPQPNGNGHHEREIALPVDDAASATQRFVLQRLSAGTRQQLPEAVVGSLFEVMGYRVESLARVNGDGAAELVAAAHPLAIGAATLRVRVVTRPGVVDEAAVADFARALPSGEQGVIVTLGEFAPAARAVETALGTLRLVDGAELVALVTEFYDRLNPQVRERLPLKRVYVPES